MIQLYRIAAICLLGVLCADTGVSAQPVRIAEIVVSGHHKTRQRIILRELNFKAGDTIEQKNITTYFERSRNNLLNSSLFTDVQINIVLWDNANREIYVGVHVKEAWYIYPIPLFELADRNFNVWWTEQNRSLRRVNIGLRLHILNANGINDAIKFKGQLGYTPKFEVGYEVPLINRKQTLGFEVKLHYSVNKEISISNLDNKPNFVRRDDNVVFRRSYVDGALIYRPNLYISQEIRFSLRNQWLDEVLATEVNPDFFLNGSDRQRFFMLSYRFAYDHRDRGVLPTSGMFTGIEINKKGLGLLDDINTFDVLPFIEHAFSFSDDLSFYTQLRGKYALSRGKQPYYNYRALGYEEDYLRGYELYVVDGLDYAYFKNALSLRVLEALINWKKIMPVKSFRRMPLQLFVTAYYDTGYVNDPFYKTGNSFTNTWLHGGGIGLNLFIYNIFSFQVELSANHLGEKGVFLHSKTSF